MSKTPFPSSADHQGGTVRIETEKFVELHRLFTGVAGGELQKYMSINHWLLREAHKHGWSQFASVRVRNGAPVIVLSTSENLTSGELEGILQTGQQFDGALVATFTGGSPDWVDIAIYNEKHRRVYV